MKIKAIEFENFRPFREHGRMEFSTDGKMTIVYGKNGVGKTTLHQLLQWIFYGKTNFNQTSTELLYNFSFEKEQSIHSRFCVLGKVEFIHNGEEYNLVRRFYYQKENTKSIKVGEDFSLQKKDLCDNWIKEDFPEKKIDELLPEELSSYFFFDGENMITELSVKSVESAEKLKKVFYKIFDLDQLQMGIDHIGRPDLKTTVLGKLYLSKGVGDNSKDIDKLRSSILQIQDRIAKLIKDKEEKDTLKKKLQNDNRIISEKIGATKSKSEYENQRKSIIEQRENLLRDMKETLAEFGKIVTTVYLDILVSKRVGEAKKQLKNGLEDPKLPSGLNKQLVEYLLLSNRCVCGHHIDDDDKEHIRNYLKLLPPMSFQSLYQEFQREASQIGANYDKGILVNIIKKYLNKSNIAGKCDQDVVDLDNIQKKSPDIESLVIKRKENEDTINELEVTMTSDSNKLTAYNVLLKKQMDAYTKITEDNENAKIVSKKMSIMEEVKRRLEDNLGQATKTYSECLEQEINKLLTEMDSRRTASVSSEFAVSVKDNYNDEYKNGGLFAVSSFAYVGGILNTLKQFDRLKNKEYPLVLDGPFSKLDADYRVNVVKSLSNFAPQVIIFSKDDLQGVVSSDKIGKTWTIRSCNIEKNLAKVSEGKVW